MRVKFNHFTVAILNVTLDCQNMFKTLVKILMHQSWRNEIEAIFPQFLSSKVKRNEAEEFSPVPELKKRILKQYSANSFVNLNC